MSSTSKAVKSVKAIPSKTKVISTKQSADTKSSGSESEQSGSNQAVVPVVGFIGLPSAGKSSAVNSLIGKHILGTGVCRTTTNVHYIGMHNALKLPDEQYHKQDPVSDDGVHYSIIDLPGVADSENSKNEESFDKMTQEYAAKCDVICWVTDIRTAFLTSHEKAEFDKVKNMLNTISTETGKLYQMFVLMSKYDNEDEPSSVSHSRSASTSSNASKTQSTSKLIDFSEEESEEIEPDEDELSVDQEDTTVGDCLKRVEGLLKGTGTILMKFNAFGRIVHSGKSTPKLKTYIRKITPYVSKVNIRFDAKWMIKDFGVKQQRSYLNTLINYHFNGGGVMCQWNVKYNGTLGVTCQGGNSCPYHTPNCRCGYAKSASTCNNPGSCNYHGVAPYCHHGIQKTGNCGQQFCPDHGLLNRAVKYDYDKINEIIRSITNFEVIDDMLWFMTINSENEHKQFSKEIVCDDAQYNAQKWNTFANEIKPQKRLERIDQICSKMIKDFTSPDQLFRLMKIMGPHNKAVQRLYLTLTKNAIQIQIIGGGTAAGYGEPRKNMTLFSLGGPEFYKMDNEFAQNRLVATKKDWLEKVKQHRIELWGVVAESNIDIYVVLMNVWHGSLHSIFAPL